ncbi:MAG TPA: C4-type zinc ribbon domain-containing protein [Frankiaceae bacterium]
MVTASPTDQHRLLDLQGFDSAVARAAARRRSLPELAQLEAVDTVLAGLGEQARTHTVAVADLDLAMRKLEKEIDLVRSRADRDRGRMDSGQVTNAKQLTELQSEIASLGRRQGVLEDEELGLMEQREQAEAALAAVQVAIADAEQQRADLEARRDEALATLDRDAALARSRRDMLAPQLPADLLALYEKLRAENEGVGAAALVSRRCQGCHLELQGSELGRVRTAAPDAVVRCDECGRILVRTAESGL